MASQQAHTALASTLLCLTLWTNVVCNSEVDEVSSTDGESTKELILGAVGKRQLDLTRVDFANKLNKFTDTGKYNYNSKGAPVHTVLRRKYFKYLWPQPHNGLW